MIIFLVKLEVVMFCPDVRILVLLT